jgi:hypothetical protein
VSTPDDGTHDLYVVFTGSGGGALLDLDSYAFTGPGVGTPGTRVGELRAVDHCADVAGSGTADGTRIQIYDCNGTGAQTWTLP